MDSGGLKPGWTRATFGEVARQVKDHVDPATADLRRYVAGEHMDTDDLRIRRWGTVGDGYLGPAFHMRFRRGHVLYGSRRTYLRKVALADFDGVTANTTFVIATRDPTVLLPELLPFIMQTESFHEHSIEKSKGSVNPYVNFSDIAAYEFALPPLDEQCRIASACEAALEVQETAMRTRQAGIIARKALIFFLYQGGATNESRVDTPIGPLPTSWDVASLGNRYEVQLGKMMSEAARTGNRQVPYIRNANVQWNALDLGDVATMSMSHAERRKFELRHGDILACEGRHVGRSALWRGEIPGACYQKALHRLRRLDDNRDVPEYLLHCLQYYSWAGRFSVQTGETTIPHLPADRLRAMLFPFPPRAAQAHIAGAIRTFDDALRHLPNRLVRARAILDSLEARVAP